MDIHARMRELDEQFKEPEASKLQKAPFQITAKVFGSPEQEQDVRIEFDYYPVRKSLDHSISYIVNLCKVLDPIEFKPSDLKFDLEIAIAELFGAEVSDMTIECEVEVSIVNYVTV